MVAQANRVGAGFIGQLPGSPFRVNEACQETVIEFDPDVDAAGFRTA
jgi:hypothetical protein